ncbi:Pyruvate dehydrogenase E1 component subunit alpha (plasmid) [Rhodococcus ruber]
MDVIETIPEAVPRFPEEETVGPGGERVLPSILLPDGSLAAGASSPMSDEQLLEALALMTRSRLVDERGVSYQRQGRIGTFSEVRGQEAASAGSSLALDPGKDWIAQSYRELPALLRYGLSLTTYWTLFIGHPGGWKYPDGMRVLPLQIELATQLPHAAGIAWGLKLKKEPGVVLGYFGDGASSEGDFYEAGNLAGVLDAPLVLFCQNNGWAISTPTDRQTKVTNIAAKATAFGIPGVVVDGNDVMAVYAATREAVDRAESGAGPTLIEAKTYRLGAHNTSDEPRRYRENAAVTEWEQLDPLVRLRRHLTARGLWDDQRDAEFRKTALSEIDAHFNEALAVAGKRSPEMLFDHVYAEPTTRMRIQRDTILDEE